MEFDEILKYKPNLEFGPSENADSSALRSKRKRPEDQAMEAQERQTEIERMRILNSIAADDQELDEFDLSALRKHCLALEKRIKKNVEMRVKYADDPTRFMDSEMELHEELQTFHVVATAPQFYLEFVKLNTLSQLVGLLSHENTDIAREAIACLFEMTDADSNDDEEDDANLGMSALAEALMGLQFFPLLTTLLNRFKEPEDSEGVHQALGIIENLVDINEGLVLRAGQESDIIAWILKRLKSKGIDVDANKLYASEILAILMQNCGPNRRRLGMLDGIDSLLQSVAIYKKVDPVTPEEVEIMENLFDTICSVVQYPDNRKLFIAAEGIDLLIIMLRSKKLSQHGALKVLDHVMAGKPGIEACAKFVDRLGLKSLFPLFMHVPSSKSARKNYSESETEEHVCAIISSLLKNLQDPVHVQRVLCKFVEQDGSKTDRLAELHVAYYKKVDECSQALEVEKQDLIAEGEEIDEVVENDHYLRRLDAGLFTLQKIDYIIAHICTHCGAEAKQRMQKLLNLKNSSMKSVRSILDEYGRNVGEDDESPDATAEFDGFSLEESAIRYLMKSLA